MFKNIIDSFLIIDAKDKPAPSFLTAYVFTWLVWHNETTLAFFKTKGDFTTRFNASLNITTENQWLIVLCLTFFVVLVRFVLNNSIYYAREFIDSKTQGRLTKKGHKSFKSDNDYQRLMSKVSSLQSDLLTSQDREKSAKTTENEATAAMLDLTIDRDKFKASYESELKITTELQNTVDLQIQQKEGDRINIADLEEKNSRSKIKIIALENENAGIKDHLGTILARLRAWVQNTNNDDINLIGITRHEENDEVVGKLSDLLESIIIRPNASLNEVDKKLSQIKAFDMNYVKSTRGGLAQLQGELDRISKESHGNTSGIFQEGLNKAQSKLDWLNSGVYGNSAENFQVVLDQAQAEIKELDVLTKSSPLITTQ